MFPVAITLFVICAVEFLIRYSIDRPVRKSPTVRGVLDKRLKLMLLGLLINVIFIYIRLVTFLVLNFTRPGLT